MPARQVRGSEEGRRERREELQLSSMSERFFLGPRQRAGLPSFYEKFGEKLGVSREEWGALLIEAYRQRENYKWFERIAEEKNRFLAAVLFAAAQNFRRVGNSIYLPTRFATGLMYWARRMAMGVEIKRRFLRTKTDGKVEMLDEGRFGQFRSLAGWEMRFSLEEVERAARGQRRQAERGVRWIRGLDEEFIIPIEYARLGSFRERFPNLEASAAAVTAYERFAETYNTLLKKVEDGKKITNQELKRLRERWEALRKHFSQLPSFEEIFEKWVWLTPEEQRSGRVLGVLNDVLIMRLREREERTEEEQGEGEGRIIRLGEINNEKFIEVSATIEREGQREERVVRVDPSLLEGVDQERWQERIKRMLEEKGYQIVRLGHPGVVERTIGEELILNPWETPPLRRTDQQTTREGRREERRAVQTREERAAAVRRREVREEERPRRRARERTVREEEERARREVAEGETARRAIAGAIRRARQVVERFNSELERGRIILRRGGTEPLERYIEAYATLRVGGQTRRARVIVEPQLLEGVGRAQRAARIKEMLERWKRFYGAVGEEFEVVEVTQVRLRRRAREVETAKIEVDLGEQVEAVEWGKKRMREPLERIRINYEGREITLTEEELRRLEEGIRIDPQRQTQYDGKIIAAWYRDWLVVVVGAVRTVLNNQRDRENRPERENIIVRVENIERERIREGVRYFERLKELIQQKIGRELTDREVVDGIVAPLLDELPSKY